MSLKTIKANLDECVVVAGGIPSSTAEIRSLVREHGYEPVGRVQRDSAANPEWTMAVVRAYDRTNDTDVIVPVISLRAYSEICG